MNELEPYLRRISETHPSVTWKDATLDVDEGMDYAVVVLDDRLVFRFRRSDGTPSVGLATEMALLDELQPQSSIEIPRYVYRAPDESFGGYAFIPGKELDVSRPTRQFLSRESRISLAGFLSGLHSFSKDRARALGVGDSQSYESVARGAGREAGVMAHLLTDHERGFVENAIAEIATLEFDDECLIHGDLHEGNILLGEEGIAGIIDFGDVEIGDPSVDFGITWDIGEEFAASVYEYYRGPKDETFLRRAELNNLNVHIRNTYEGLEEDREEWWRPSLRRIRRIVAGGFATG